MDPFSYQSYGLTSFLQDPAAKQWMTATGDRAHHSNGGWLDMSAQWNFFRRIGDLLHVAGTLILVGCIFYRGSVIGISWKTQAMYTLVFCTRYLDLYNNVAEFLGNKETAERKVKVEYLICFKSMYILFQFIILGAFWYYNQGQLGINAGGNYEQNKDTVNIYFIMAPTAICAMLFADESTLMERLWTWSEYLEAFSMLPQYVFQYRLSKRESVKGHLSVFAWIICIGLYRIFYFFNWVYRVSHTSEGVQWASWVGGGMQILFFLDFLVYYPLDFSLLKSAVLYADDKVCDAGDAIELTMFPAREHEVEQKKLRRRNLGEDNPYQQIRGLGDMNDDIDNRVPRGLGSRAPARPEGFGGGGMVGMTNFGGNTFDDVL